MKHPVEFFKMIRPGDKSMSNTMKVGSTYRYRFRYTYTYRCKSMSNTMKVGATL